MTIFKIKAQKVSEWFGTAGTEMLKALEQRWEKPAKKRTGVGDATERAKA